MHDNLGTQWMVLYKDIMWLGIGKKKKNNASYIGLIPLKMNIIHLEGLKIISDLSPPLTLWFMPPILKSTPCEEEGIIKERKEPCQGQKVISRSRCIQQVVHSVPATKR